MAKLPSTVVQFRQTQAPVPEVSVAVARRSVAPQVVTSEPGVDLSGKPKVIFLIGRGGSGKAQPLDSLVLTPAGFRRMGDLTVGDHVTCPGGQVSAIVGVFPQGEKEIFEIEFSDGRRVQCCDDHLWRVWIPGQVKETGRSHATRGHIASGQWKTESTREIRARIALGAKSPRAARRCREMAVPLAAPYAIEFPPQPLPVPPYVLGALLGDGNLCHGNIVFSTADDAMIERIHAELPEYELMSVGGASRYDYRIKMRPRLKENLKHYAADRLTIQLAAASNNTLRIAVKPDNAGGHRRVLARSGSRKGVATIRCRDLTMTIAQWASHIGTYPEMLRSRLAQMPIEQALQPERTAPRNTEAWSTPLKRAIADLGLWGLESHEKFIPPSYKIGSVSQRLAVLQGLLDTDGSASASHATFSSTSERLARDVQEIAWSLGGAASIKRRQTYFTNKAGVKVPGRPSWRVSIVHPDVTQMFSLPRKVGQCSPSTQSRNLRIAAIRSVGKKSAQCIAVDHPDHLYVTDNFVVTHNTTLGRWMLERANEAKRDTIAAALDPVNRTLANYVSGVAQPETSDPAVSARFLRELLGFAMEHKQSAVVDLGGGDTTLATVLDEMPDLASVLEGAGLSAVALYLLTPRIDDIAPFLSLGFQPSATAFVCNRVTPGDFEPLLEQRAIREAITAGAREAHMPRLDADATAFIEQHRLSFSAASRGEKGVGPWRAAQVRNWLTAMDKAFAGINSWLA